MAEKDSKESYFIQAVKRLGWWERYKQLKDIIDACEILNKFPIELSECDSSTVGIRHHIEKLLSCGVCYPKAYVIDVDDHEEQPMSCPEKINLSALYQKVNYHFPIEHKLGKIDDAMSDNPAHGATLKPIRALLTLYTVTNAADALALADLGDWAFIKVTDSDLAKIKTQRDAVLKSMTIDDTEEEKTD